MWDPPVRHPHLYGHVRVAPTHQHPSSPLLETNSNNRPCSVLLPLLAMMLAVEQLRAPSDAENPILLVPWRHAPCPLLQACGLCTIVSPTSPLRPNKAAFLRHARVTSSMGSGRGGRDNHGGDDGLDGSSHGGEDGLDGRRPRDRARRTRWVASVVTSMRRGQEVWVPQWRPRCGAGEQHGAPRR
jgi:hypothetical protein